jgi:hypothetical protein
MAQRTRSILIDSTLGKIFTGVTDVASASASNLIAGAQRSTKTFATAAATSARVAYNLSGGNGLYMGNNGILTNVSMTVATAPIGAAIIIVLKKGATYATSSVIGTYNIPNGLSSSSNPVSISFLSTDYFFIDITQVGLTKPGNGLIIQLGYYAGY